MADASSLTTSPRLPRVAITYCTKCRWMLRAAYLAQELLSTFETKIGEVALIPTTGGIFEVNLTLADDGKTLSDTGDSKTVLLWDFKSKRCFPETKILKQLVRNQIDPDRSLGHSDTASHLETRATSVLANDSSVEEAQLVSADAKERPYSIKDDCVDCQ